MVFLYNILIIQHTTDEVTVKLFLSILTVNNQLTLLYDLLDEHRTYSPISNNEYRQIKRLVQTITSNHRINDEDLQGILPEIYNYSIKGELVQSLNEHIETNKQNIEKWLNTIDKTKKSIS